MFTWIRRFIAPPIFEDEDKTRVAGLLNIILLATIVITFSFAVAVGLLATPPSVINLIIGAACGLLELVLWFAMRRGRVRLASVLFSVIILAGITAAIYSSGDAQGPVAFGYIICIVAAGILIGNRATVVFTVASLLILLGLYQAEAAGLLPPSVGSDNVVSFTGIAAVFSITAVLIGLASRNITSALESARRNEHALAEANEGLQREIAERKRAERVQAVIYRISEAAQTAQDLGELFGSIHAIVGELMPARNFYIALYDVFADVFITPYLVDEFGTPPPPYKPAKGLTAHVFRTGEPLLVTPGTFDRLVQSGQVELIGRPTVDWLGVPLKTQHGPIGVMAVYTYTDAARLEEADKDILAFVSTQVAMAIERKRTEEALRESEERHRIVSELISDFAYAVRVEPDGSLVIEWATAAFTRITGFTPEEIKAHGAWQTLPHPEDLPIVFEFAQRLLSGKSDVSDFRIVTKDGEVRWLRDYGHPVWDERQARVVRIIGAAQDITERKRAEQALQESENRFRTLAAASFEGIALIKQGVFLDLSDQLAQMLGYHRDELLGTPVIDCVTPEHRELVAQSMRSGRLEPYEHLALRKDGTVFLVEARARSTRIGDQEIRVTAIRDITERKRVEETLRESEARYRAVIESQVDLISRYLPDTTLTFVNDAYCKFYGKTREELIGHSYLFMIAPEFRELVRKETEDLSKAPRPLAGEYLNYRHDGKECWIQWVVQCISDENGQVVELQAVGRDITERKQAEEALKESEKKYRSVVDNIQDVFYRSDKSGRLTMSSPSGARMFGYASVEEMLGLPLETFWLNPRERETALSKIREMGRISDHEAMFVRKDGMPFPVSISAHFYYDEAGTFQGTEGIIRDITEHKRAKEVLQESESRYRGLFENVPISLWEEDFSAVKAYVDELQAKGIADLRAYFENQPKAIAHCVTLAKILDVNKATLELYRAKSKKELLGNLDRVLGPEAYDVFKEELLALAEGESPFSKEVINSTLTGDKIHVNLSLSVAPGEEDTWSRVLVSITDITERKQAEEALQKAYAEVEKQVEERTAELQREIAERKEAQEALRVSEERFALAVRGSNDGIWDWDIANNTLYWSPRLKELLGYTDDELDVNFDMFEAFLHPDDRERIGAALEAHLRDRRPYDVEYRPRIKSGEYRWFRARGQAFWDETGQPLRMAGSVTDITELKQAQEALWKAYEEVEKQVQERTAELQREMAERKEAEEEIRRLNAELEQRVVERTAQLEAANKELEAFSYSVSHDLRAPLRHIAGFVQLLHEREAGRLDATSSHYLDIIAQSSHKMDRLIDDLLALSRAGRAELQIQPVELDGLVRETQQELTPEMEGRHITWEISPLPAVEGDPALLRQVWMNLLSNAIKFTAPRAEACIEIGVKRGDADDSVKKGEATIFVRDNGVGFDPQYARKLFGVFQRLHREEEFEGTGIGLAIVRRIIHRHGGEVWAEGEIDHGATFYFTLREAKGE